MVAANQVGVDSERVNTLFTGSAGALALALSLTFGLGGRDTAGCIVDSWYRRGQQVAPQMREAANQLRQQTAERVVDTQRELREWGVRYRPSGHHSGHERIQLR